MTVREDILAKLKANPIMKIIGEPRQGDINTLKQERAEKTAKIKMTEDVVEMGRRFCFIVVVLGHQKYGIVIGNLAVWWETPEDPGGYDKTIQAKDSSFDQSKGEKKHARKVIKYEKFLGVEESIRTLLLQVVEESYLEAPKEKYIGYGWWTLFKMIEHLQTKISKVTNINTVRLKKEVFIIWEQPQVLSAYFKPIEKARKQLAKWNVKVSDNDIAIHVMDQMYELDWVSEEIMTTWAETQDNKKTWPKCQTFFDAAYIARKRYINAKGQLTESINKIIKADCNMYLMAMDAKSAQETKEHNKHIQQVMGQNAILLALVQEQ